MKIINLLLIGVCLVAASFAQAGQERGGADAVKLPNGKYQILDLVEKDEVDYIQMRVSDYDPEMSFVITKLFVDDLDRKQQSEILFDGDLDFTRLFLLAMNDLYETTNFIEYMKSQGYQMEPLVWAFTDQDLPEVDDEGVIHIDNPKSKKQLAVQTGNFVLVQRNEFNSLDGTSKAALITHESFLYAVKTINPNYFKINGTEKVRTLNRRFISYLKGWDLDGYSSMSSYPAGVVKESFQQLNLRSK